MWNLFTKLERGLNLLYEWGFTPETVKKKSLLTPACGMGTMATSDAEKALNLLSGLSRKFTDRG